MPKKTYSFGKTARKGSNQVRKYVKRNVAHRYASNRGGMVQLAKDVMVLKSIVNAEKKRYTENIGGQLVGQVNDISEGAYYADITPTPSQGTGESQRIGDSLKLSTGVLHVQLKHQGNTSHGTKLILELYQVLGTPQVVKTAFEQMYNPTPWLNDGDPIRDYSASHNQDFRQHYRLIMKRKLYVANDNVSGQTRHNTYKFPLKFGKFGQHIKYDDDSTTVASGQIIMIIRADSGNTDPSSPSTITNVISNGVSSGLVLNRYMEYYYFDN